MPNTIFALICVIGIILYYEADLRLRFIFRPRGLQRRLAYVSWKVPQLFFAVAERYIGLHFRFEIPEEVKLPPQFMVVSNHQSLVDIPVLFYYFRSRSLRFVAKKELGRGVPLISQVLRYQGHCLVDRQADRMKSMKTIDAFARAVVDRGWCPAIFPEGTRSRDGSVGPFLGAGMRRILELAPMPVVTVAIDGGWRISEFGQIVENARSGAYRLRVLSVHPAPSTRREAAALVEGCRLEIASQISAWRGKDVLRPSAPIPAPAAQQRAGL